MVKLFGVVTSVEGSEEFLGIPIGSSWDIDFKPSIGLISYLRKLPKGSKIGIQEFKEEEWNEIKDELLIREVRVKGRSKYWNHIIDICESKTHEIVFLEDADVFLGGVDETEIASKHNSIFDTHLVRNEGESKREYDRKLITFNENFHRAEMRARGVMELERGKVLLENVQNNDLDAAIVGIGFSHPWVFEDGYFPIGDYAEETVIYTNEEVFEGNYVARPKKRTEFIWERRGLERTVKLIQEGRLTEGKPDFVGIWGGFGGMVEPSKGYFEVFVSQRRDDGSIVGTIEDTLGTAIFIGKETEEGIMFTKTYSQGDSTIPKKGLDYRLSNVHNGLYGFCLVENNDGGRFYLPIFMVEGEKAKPKNLAMESYEHWENKDLSEKIISEMKKYDKV